MSASLTLTGLRELAKSLDVLPAGLEDAAGQTVREAAFATANTLRSALPQGPARWLWRTGQKSTWYPGGNLRKGVKIKKLDTTRYQVVSSAPHAWINEYGTTNRENRHGANRGVSPPSKIVAGVASDKRREMNGKLEQVLVRVLGTLV